MSLPTDLTSLVHLIVRRYNSNWNLPGTSSSDPLQLKSPLPHFKSLSRSVRSFVASDATCCSIVYCFYVIDIASSVSVPRTVKEHELVWGRIRGTEITNDFMIAVHVKPQDLRSLSDKQNPHHAERAFSLKKSNLKSLLVIAVHIKRHDPTWVIRILIVQPINFVYRNKALPFHSHSLIKVVQSFVEELSNARG